MTQNKMENGAKALSDNYVLFIDVLYAVLVGETVFQYGNELFGVLSVSTVYLVITYVSIVTSFIFWHSAIKKYPHKNPWRFFIDIAVILTYFGIIFNHGYLNNLLIGFIILYAFYLLWNWLLTREYGKGASRLLPSLENVAVLLGYFVFVNALVIFYSLPSIITEFTAMFFLIGFIIWSQIKELLKIVKFS